MPLTDDERAEIRGLLEDLIARLESRMKRSGDQGDPVSLDEPIGRLSRMDALQSQEMAKAGLSREHDQLVLARHALSLVDAPDFGTCTSCKREIGVDRLLFQPEILLCVRCA